MNKHLKCALKILALPILLVYGLLVVVVVVLTIVFSFPVAFVGFATGCFDIEEAGVLDSVVDFLLFPIVWFRQL